MVSRRHAAAASASSSMVSAIRVVRLKVWCVVVAVPSDAAGDRSPALAATAKDPLIIDLDATPVTSHSDKENVAGTYKGGYGFAPFIASVDYGGGNGSGEILAAVLRPGNAGANSAEDHIRVFHTAAAQLPQSFFTEAGALAGEKVLVRTDSAGASRKFLWHLHSLGVQFSISYTLPFGKAHMIDWITDKQYWQPALDQSGNDRDDAWVINATDVVTLTDYPPGTNLFLRAEPLHPGAQPTLLDADGHRITAFLTNSPRWHGPFLDARHRARGRCENRIKTLKTPAWQAAVLRLRRDPGLGKHRRAGLQHRLLAPARRPPGRAPRQGLGHQTLALSALRDRRENHHPRPPQPAPATGIGPGKGSPETSPGEQRPAQQMARSFHRLIVDLVPPQRTARSPEVEPAPTRRTNGPHQTARKQKTTAHQPRPQISGHQRAS